VSKNMLAHAHVRAYMRVHTFVLRERCLIRRQIFRQKECAASVRGFGCIMKGIACMHDTEYFVCHNRPANAMQVVSHIGVSVKCKRKGDAL
jgi:hypothetical protein